MSGVADPVNFGSHSLQRVSAAFRSHPGPPFDRVLSAERIERAFARHGNLSGSGAVYSTAVLVWSFLGQESWLRKGRHAELIDGFMFTAGLFLAPHIEKFLK